jgi:hypothetical protein
VAVSTKVAEQAGFFRRWTVLWRSIVLSSVDADDERGGGGGRTYKPYCRYIKTLDFRNLSAMLDDPKFTGAVRKAFFVDLSAFHFPRKEFNRQVVDVMATVDAVGDAVTAKATLLEEIDGHIWPAGLTRWISRSPKLETLVLWKGMALVEGAGAAIAQHCENFKNLTLHEFQNASVGDEGDADEVFEHFLSDLRPNTMAYFEMISYNDLARRSFEALGRHNKTLQHLDLGNLNKDAVRNLNALKACTEIHTLKLDDEFGTVQLEALHNDVFLEVVDWLGSCRNLRELSLQKFFDGPALLSRVLYSPHVKLTRLSLEGYTVRHTSAQLFHSALAEQKSLESVWLKGNGEDTTPDDLQIMVDGLSNLTNLRELVLKDVSDEFAEEHIISLALNLPLLEDFWTSGGEVSADILPPLANLHHLKNLTLYAMTQFPSDAIIDFLSSLNPETQRGFNMSMMAVDPEFDLTEVEQEMISDYIRANLDGRIDMVLWREADPSDSEDD